MRQIKFRQARHRNGEFADWHYWGFLNPNEARFVGPISMTDPSFQYTGLLDKNGKEIWEGDVVRIQHPEDKGGDFGNTIGRVFWWDDEAAFYHGNNSGRPPKRMWEYCEVLGNIYENPEILK